MSSKKRYEKDFDAWNLIKKVTESQSLERLPYFFEREVWWCRLGCNIGFEQYGRSKGFMRPILIIRKFNKHLFMGIPFSTQSKRYPFYFSVGVLNTVPQFAILSQTRPLSSKRLVNKMGVLSEKSFIETRKAASEYIFGS